MWNFNLADAAFGWLVLEIEGGRVGTEMRAQGFNFAHRSMKQPQLQADMLKPSAAPINAPYGNSMQQNAQQGQSNPQISMPPSGPAQSTAPQRLMSQQQQAPSQRPQPPSQSQSQRSAQPTPPVQPAASKPTTPGNARSPAPPVVNANTKPATPAAAPPPTSTTPVINGMNETTSAESDPNGTTAAAHDVTKESTPPPAKKPSQGIFISNVNSETEARDLFSDADKAKIVRVDRLGKFYVAHFSSPEEMQAVLRGAPADLKKLQGMTKPNIRQYEDRSGHRRQYEGAGSWGSTRGGSNAQGSYRNTETQDGESVRGGRGGFRGRGRGNGERGGRGRGRGYHKGGAEGGDSSAPAPSSAPAAATTSSGNA